MKKIVLILLGLLVAFVSVAQNSEKTPTDNSNDPYATYKLYPTHNMWTFLKLNTANGKLWQVQYSVEGDQYRYETILNAVPYAVGGEKAKPGRFSLYPTKNIWTFLMLDQLEGAVYQVQWSQEAENRGVVRIL